ncbi:MAG TPA: DeoR/GlpR family DNA-binding transcription regulator, partial [Armatimonadota bacterium]|nr:DeoR/GlpR family DNA-binding transcription regulator [Armatimonadota bacterium]
MNERQEGILASIRQGQRVRVRELAERFGVSEMTIRRDLVALEAQGLLIRTHGGGAPVSRLRAPDGALTPASPEKVAIGRAAAALAAPGETVMVDAGTTALQVARHLPRDAGLIVVTTSLLVAQELYGAGPRLLLLGGFLRDDFPGVYGPLTETALASLRVDILFIGCDGASAEEGFYTADLHLLSLERAMIAAAA